MLRRVQAAFTTEIGIASRDATRSRSHGVDRLIGDWAETHFGLISYRRLKAFGLTDADVHGRVSRGTLRPAVPGVFFVGHRSGVPGQREALVLAAAGPGAVLAGPSAAGWIGMVEAWRGDVCVIAPRSRAGERGGGTRHADVVGPDEVTLVRGLACVVPERAVMRLPRELLRQALQWLMRNGRAVEPIVERMHGRRGARAFREEVAQLVPQMAHTMSELENRFLRLCRRFGIPMPVVNGLLAGGDLIDFSWPGNRVVVELDGRRWHMHRDREDRARDHRRLLEGRLPFRFDWSDVTRRPEQTAAAVREALAVG